MTLPPSKKTTAFTALRRASAYRFYRYLLDGGAVVALMALFFSLYCAAYATQRDAFGGYFFVAAAVAGAAQIVLLWILLRMFVDFSDMQLAKTFGVGGALAPHLRELRAASAYAGMRRCAKALALALVVYYFLEAYVTLKAMGAYSGANVSLFSLLTFSAVRESLSRALAGTFSVLVLWQLLLMAADFLDLRLRGLTAPPAEK